MSGIVVCRTDLLHEHVVTWLTLQYLMLEHVIW